MVKAYLRYEPAGVFGVISSNANIVYGSDGKTVITSCLEDVGVWNIRQGTQAQLLAPSTASSSSSSGTGAAAEATVIARPRTGQQIAVGYSDGTVRLWDLKSGDCVVTLKGHKSAVSALRYSRNGALLASGGKDTDIIVWDVAGEAGLYRLRAHKDQVTDVAFVSRGNKLLSVSKDGALRVWDLDTQHCSQTLAAAGGEVWSLDVDPTETRVVTASSDTELRVYSISDSTAPSSAATAATTAADESATTSARRHDLLSPMGSVRRVGQDRAVSVRYDAKGTLLGVLSVGKRMELFTVRSPDEALRKMRRRRKRKREKERVKTAKKRKEQDGDAAPGPAAANGEDDSDAEDAEHEDDAEGAAGDEAEDGPEVLRASDELGALLVVATKHKIKSFAFAPPGVAKKGCMAQVALGLANNAVEVLDVLKDSYNVVQRIDLPGHRGDVRALAMASDDTLLLSAASGAVKVWNPANGACLGTMESGYGLCAVFAPDNRHAVVGTKEGTIEVFNIGANARVHVEQAHTGPVWSLALLPDRSGFVSGSADKSVKFWTWSLAAAANGSGKQLSVRETRAHTMADDVLCVRLSPDGKLLAVALLDATIKVYYVDTFKFFLSLYGHKLPVLTMDISSDGTLLASGSADKNIKVWGLDFGDCHRSLFAHGDAVMQLAFVPNTHYAFSIGKDKILKYWDLDRFEALLELPGHHGEVWALAVGAYGDTVFTGSHDRSIRRWTRTSEPFFVEEEREKRLESLFEADLEQQQQRDEGAAANTADGPDAAAGTVAAAGRRTLDSVSAADNIVDALDMAAHQEEALAAHLAEKRTNPNAKPPPANPMLLGLEPGAFVLRCVGSVRANDLEQALLLLPFGDALRLMGYLDAWLAQGAQVELCCRVATLLLRLHHGQLTAAPAARPVLASLHARLRRSVQGLKDTLGFNLAALKHLQRSVKEAGGVDEMDLLAGARMKLLQ